jgi:tetratricopeptide (TPR) repeat protein
MRTLLMFVATATIAIAQAPYKLDEAFFNGDRAKVLREVTERARIMKNNDAKLLAEYGRAYLAALDVPKGKEVLRLAEAKEPNDGAVLRLIALAWLKNGFKSEALSAYEQVLRRDPKNKEALAQSGIDLAEVGLVNEAEKYMNAFLAREPEDWHWFLAFGRAFLTGGFRKQAAPWFARAATLKPDKEEVMVEILRAFTDTQSVM